MSVELDGGVQEYSSYRSRRDERIVTAETSRAFEEIYGVNPYRLQRIRLEQSMFPPSEPTGEISPAEEGSKSPIRVFHKALGRITAALISTTG